MIKKVLDDDQGSVELLSVMMDMTDHLNEPTMIPVVNAARVSYDKEVTKIGERDIKLIKYLYSHEHTSPFEMMEFKFRVVLPLFVFNQWRTHRTFKYWNRNEISRRYTSEDIRFYVPNNFYKQDKKNKQCSEKEIHEHSSWMSGAMQDTITKCFTLYQILLDKGISREDARMILPQNMMTKVILKVDGHNLLNFLRLRMDKSAQHQMVEYANAVWELVKDYYKEIWDEY
jgi:thymidylate synthase (FAD)